MSAHSMEIRRIRRGSACSGAALVLVLGLTFLAGGVAAWLAASSSSHILRSRSTLRNEQAFFIAEGGAERAASHLAAGGTVPGTLRGNLGGGQYTAMLLPESMGAGVVGSLSGRIKLNPGGNTNFAFYAELPGAQRISQRDLIKGIPDYYGAATVVGVEPTGSGSQSDLYLNGSLYAITNAVTYSFRSTNMTIRVWNDNRNAQGEPLGLWWVEFNTPNASVANSATGNAIRRDTYFTIFSVGNVRDNYRSVMIRGLTTVSWSKYALWYDQEAVQLWIVGGEQFHGPVYSRQQMRFHSYKVAELGQAHFFDRALHVPTNYVVQNATVNPIFDMGITLNAPSQSMISINIPDMRNEASHVFTGTTYVSISSNRMYVTNLRRGWTNYDLPVPDDGLVYVVTTTSGDSATRPGHLHIGAADGLAGRLTFVAEQNIYVTNHIRYLRNPTVNPDSNDALGLIAGQHTVVATNAPDNLDIYAHIICKEGGFGVAEYNNAERGFRGYLNVYGGIVNRIRNAVGTTSGTGYIKNYVYDPRFRLTPPPRYPVVPNEFNWQGWDG